MPCTFLRAQDSASEAVIAYLKTRSLLLILDNCEHVTAEARELAATIVELVSRRARSSDEPRAVTRCREQVYRLPSLAVPPDSCRNSQDALRFAAIALFVDRAFAVDAGFALTDDNASAVVEICRQLGWHSAGDRVGGRALKCARARTNRPAA